MGRDEASPVEQSDLLLNIFSFLGMESYMFVAPVSKTWRDTYRKALAGRPCITRVLYALENLCVLKYSKGNKVGWNSKFFALMCGTGDLRMVVWAVENSIPLDDRALCCASRAGALNVVQFLLQQQLILNCEQCYDACASAAAGGHLKVLKYLRDEGFVWDNVVTLEAAYNGHLNILQYAKDNGCPWSPNACSVAAFNGHLELLKWLVQNGAPFDATACSLAAFGGNLSVLKWLRQQGCHWDERVLYEASCAGNLEILQWALKNGCPN